MYMYVIYKWLQLLHMCTHILINMSAQMNCLRSLQRGGNKICIQTYPHTHLDTIPVNIIVNCEYFDVIGREIFA